MPFNHADELLTDIMNAFLSAENPELYLKLYEDIKNKFENAFDTYYKKYVLSLPTLEERWNAYAHTPQEWLNNDNWIVQGIRTAVEVDGIKYTLDFGHIVCESRDRGYQFNLEDIVLEIDDWFEQICDDDVPTVRTEYSHPNKMIDVPLTNEILDSWKEQLIKRKIGSFRNDW